MSKCRKKISETTYAVPNISDKWLFNNNFRYNSDLSLSDKIYTYRFFVYKRVIEGEILVSPRENFARVNVYTVGNHSPYAPWYRNEYGKWNKMLHIINKKIFEQIKRLGLVDIDDNSWERL